MAWAVYIDGQLRSARPAWAPSTTAHRIRAHGSHRCQVSPHGHRVASATPDVAQVYEVLRWTAAPPPHHRGHTREIRDTRGRGVWRTRATIRRGRPAPRPTEIHGHGPANQRCDPSPSLPNPFGRIHTERGQRSTS